MQGDDRLNLKDLQSFARVVEHGGFTAASRALRVPKQTLSKRVAELERQAGVRLIQRTSRRFAVTELGRELYRHASEMMIAAEAANDIIAGRLAEPSGTVRITASMPSVQTKLAPLLPTIARRYDKIRIVLHGDDRFVDIVREGYDLALRTHFAPLPDSELVQRRLRTDDFWLVASPEFVAHFRPSSVEKLGKLPLISSIEGPTAWSLTSADGRTTTLPLLATFVANEGTAILEAASAGLGVASLPASMCSGHVESRQLVRVCPEWTAGRLTTTLIMPSKRGLLPSVRVVADAIVEALSDI